MMSGSRKNRPLRPFILLSLLAALAFAAGCSTANTTGGGDTSVNHLDASGKSVPGWVIPTGGSLHADAATREYISNGSLSSCSSCHGGDLSGGISKVSCFDPASATGCHHGTMPDWVNEQNHEQPQGHGTSAKRPPGDGSFFSCQICHGTDFSGGGADVSCVNTDADCHGVGLRSPHPAKPWRGLSGSPYTHTNTDPANDPVCYQCHAYTGTANPNNPHVPPTPAPAGTSPGCFNGTMCHNRAGHPAGWAATAPAVQPHGDSAKATAGAATGFSYCQACHGTGTNFSGGSSGVSCYTCHGVSAPHAPKPWRASAGSTYTHTTTIETGNAAVCAFCHFPGSPNNPANHPATPAPAGTPPGCFNSTLCHGQAGHPAGWAATAPADQPHGDSAKATPGSTAGYAYCQTCHGAGTNFSGGSSGVSCYTCHVPTANSPHASQWRTGDTYVHTTTAAGNAPVCAFCHLNGANSPIAPPSPPAPTGTAPGCFNSTLCHGELGHAVPYNDPSHYGVTSGTFAGSCGVCHAVTGTSPVSGAPLCTTCHIAGSPLTALNCTSCHVNPPNGATTTYPNVAGAHATHIALNGAGTPVSCNTCHNGLGTGTLNHYNRAKSQVPPGDAAFPATYNAKTGASSFDNSASLNCSNVSCHGGQATPNWRTGTLNVNTQCTICHAQGTGQYNSYNSGEHGINSNHSNCTNCHNTTTLAVNHFTALGTTTMEGPASATIGGAGTSVNSYVASTKSCSPSCHGTETW